ncbi:hypothetical protein RZA67_09930 [Stenotrophomonas sp. C3(2023)]|uniref:hypothetical protein n=1 Tax=Stenotrophomonas sp. C3(2023) TaxID=3080277 RepID=UPI00293CE468|nr:hypothetical protein [Stenotrophomonas sp. C3(2023)]MDV3469048.1 hypothetical protein [Stenotrophomonas sp. C3(2023)]
MIIVSLVQGTPEWHVHRAVHLNASEAPVMLGEFPTITRAQLLKVRATGVAQEISWFLQKIFDDGYRFEALARPLAEEIIGQDLYPCVGKSGSLSASFDGLTLLQDIVFEHKTLNATLRSALTAIADEVASSRPEDEAVRDHLPLQYQIQMEQQLAVSGAERALFMASKWTDEGELIEELHCWYYPNPDLRARIVAGWAQFEADVCSYQVVQVAEPVVGKAPDQLPALRIELTGMVKSSNLADFRQNAMAVLGAINRDLRTDTDFADAEQTVKWAKEVEGKLEAAKDHALSQTADIDALFRTLDDVKAEARRVRLELEKLVTKRKDERRIEIVQAGRSDVQAHYEQINATLGQHAIAFPVQAVTNELGAVIKGKRSFSAMEDEVSATAANIKIAASQQAERIRGNVAILNEHALHAFLFQDRVQLCAGKAPEDLRNLVAARIAEHQKAEQERLEAERARIRKEEEDRAARLQQEKEAQAARDAAAAAEAAKPAPAPEPVAQPAAAAPAATQKSHVQAVADLVGDRPVAPATAAADGKRIKLGEINDLIGPLSISAEGLRQLGFDPVSTERGAKLYAADQVPAMCEQMIRVLRAAAIGERHPLAA